MELGATVCLPRAPECGRCPVERFCAARAAGVEKELPVKLRKQKPRDVRIDLVVLQSERRVVLMRRPSSERRLADFWELPGKELFRGIRCRRLHEFRHQIVNDRFRVAVWTARADPPAEGRWFAPDELDRIPVTTITRKALEACITSAAGR